MLERVKFVLEEVPACHYRIKESNVPINVVKMQPVCYDNTLYSIKSFFVLKKSILEKIYEKLR